MHGEVRREVLQVFGDLVPDDRELRSVVLELVAEFLRSVERIVLDDDRAETQDGVEGDDVLRAVRQHERNGIARADAERSEAGGGASDQRIELRVGRGRAEELEGDSVRIAGRGRLHEVAEAAGLPGDVVWHVCGVARQPRAIVRRTGTAAGVVLGHGPTVEATPDGGLRR